MSMDNKHLVQLSNLEHSPNHFRIVRLVWRQIKILADVQIMEKIRTIDCLHRRRLTVQLEVEQPEE